MQPRRLVLLIVLVLASCFAYANSFAGVFVFDDIVRIVEEERIRRVWPLGPLLSGERPVVDLSLAVNYAIGGLNPCGYHAFNLAVHILAGLTLFGIVRRTIELWQRGGSTNRRSPMANWRSLIAFAVALIFLVHPLQTQSVTYVIQRGESMMGLFYLLTLYCAIRAMDSQRRRLWYVGAVLACALGMGTKAVMVTAPVMVMLYDWVFLARGANPRAKYAFPKQRLPLYVGLMATWSVLWLCGIVSETLGHSSTTSHVGFSYKGISALQYAATQPGVICKYLQLALWPASQCIDYDWPVAATWQRIAPPAVCAGILLAVTAWLLYRRHWLGFAGAWFFLILAPTSSFVPIKDLMFEHRMYLPLAAVISVIIVPLGFALAHWFGSATSVMETCTGIPATEGYTNNRSGKLTYGTLIPTVVIVAFAAPLAYATHLRNRIYHSELALWQDVVAKRPGNARAHLALGNAWAALGDLEKAVALTRQSTRISPDYADGHCALGIFLVRQGHLVEAIASYQEAVRLEPGHSRAWYQLGNALDKLLRYAEAEQAYENSIQANPTFADAYTNYGNTLMRHSKPDAAIAMFRRATEVAPNHVKAHNNLGDALASAGDVTAAQKEFELALSLQPDYHKARVNLVLVLRRQGRLAEAIKQCNMVLEREPTNPAARELRSEIEAELKR